MKQATSISMTGLVLGAGGAVLFSLKGVFAKLAFQQGATVEQMMALRMGFALPVFLILGVLAFRQASQRPSLRDYLLAGGLGVLSYYVCTWLDFTGLQYISAQLERLILFLYPTFTALFARFYLGDRITLGHGVALCLSYAGVAILFGREMQLQGMNVALGSGLVLAAAILFAGYVTAAKPVITRMGSRLFTTVSMAAAAVAILVHTSAAAAYGPELVFNGNIVAIGLILALACTVAPSFMISEAIARIGPGMASAVGGVGPVATAILAVLLVGEAFGVEHALALVLTVGGVLALSWRRKSER